MRMTYLWLLHLFSGLTILVVSGIHLISIHTRVIMKLFGAEAVAASQPDGDTWAAVLVFMSAIILVHALIGLRQTVLEMAPSARKTRIINWAIIAGGIILLVGASSLPSALISR